MLHHLKNRLDQKLENSLHHSKKIFNLMRNAEICVQSEALLKLISKAEHIYSVHLQIDEVICIDVKLKDTSQIYFELKPVRISWSAQGAKEIFFKVSPQPMSDRPIVADIASTIVGAIGESFYSAGFKKTEHCTWKPFAEKENHGVLRFDIQLQHKLVQNSNLLQNPMRMMEIKQILLESNKVKIRIAAPLSFSSK